MAPSIAQLMAAALKPPAQPKEDVVLAIAFHMLALKDLTLPVSFKFRIQ